MAVALKSNLSDSELRRINNVRQSLQATFVSDISDPEGTHISVKAWCCKVDGASRHNTAWPRTGQISKADKKLWHHVLSLLTGSPHQLQLRVPLGSWYVDPEIKWQYSKASGRVYQKCGLICAPYVPIGNRSSKGLMVFKKVNVDDDDNPAIKFCSSDIPRDAVPVDVRKVAKGIMLSTSPAIERGDDPQKKLWWDQSQFYWKWKGEENLEKLERIMESNQAIIVSDGSFKQAHATAAFVIGERDIVMPLIQGQVIVPGATHQLSPYRAKVFGILSVIAWVENFTYTHEIKQSRIRCGCDEAGFKRLVSSKPMTVHQPDFDIINAIKEATRNSIHEWEFFWVRGHQDAVKQTLTQEEQMNVMSDSLAKECWQAT